MICYSSPRKLIHWARMNFMLVHTLYPEPSLPCNNLYLDIEPSFYCRLTSTLCKIYSQESHCPILQPASTGAAPNTIGMISYIRTSVGDGVVRVPAHLLKESSTLCKFGCKRSLLVRMHQFKMPEHPNSNKWKHYSNPYNI